MVPGLGDRLDASTQPPSVLVVDDEADTRERVSELLRRHGLITHQAASAQDALRAIRQQTIDVVLVDLVVQDTGGLECCRLIKGAVDRKSFLPVILVTTKAGADSRGADMRFGADDYLSKPFDERELLARISNLVSLKQMHDHLNNARQRLEKLAIEDELTGLHNYRDRRSRLTEEFKRAARYGEPLACVMIDIDHFKRVNDAFGHEGGDATLRETARRLEAVVREIDAVTRYGGEEFLLLLPSTNFSGALAVAERVRTSVRDTPVTISEEYTTRVTVSIGAAVYPNRDIHTEDELVKAADAALYEAKRRGRDCVCLHHHQGYLYSPDQPDPLPDARRPQP